MLGRMSSPAAPSLLLLAVLAACNGSREAPAQGGAVPLVEGTYDYRGFAPPLPYALRGTIAFEQVGDLVRVTNVTYANSFDRPLVGEANLVGDRLDIVLVPENGDTNFQADVTFIFSADRNTFEVAFSDTNGDSGNLGDYVGTKR